MKKDTRQSDLWKGDFGKLYTDRNEMTLEEMEQLYVSFFGITRTKINNEVIGDLDKDLKVLEFGCNIGNQLLCLQKMGFKNLYGIDINEYAIEKAKTRIKDIDVRLYNGDKIPYDDNSFDFVYTSGVLIHISPENINHAIKEIYRCSKRYIYGYEYFSDSYTQLVDYRGEKLALWKNDYAKLYLDTFNDLKLVREKRYPYVADKNNRDTFYLLEKQ